MNFIAHTQRWLLAASAAVALLSACGGGGLGSGGTGAAAYGTAIGTVEGFGSIYIGGERCDDLHAKVSYDTVSGGPEPANPEIRLGQRIEADLDTTASTCRILAARIAPEIVGVVDGTAPLTVAGTPVLVNTDPALGPVTVYDGYDSAADIQAGDRVEVHGKAVPAAGGVAIRATRIERKPSSDTWVRVAGVIQNLSSTQFTLGGLTVNYSGATTIVPAGVALANGQTVAMWSLGAVVNNTVTARFIRVLRRHFADGLHVRVAGPARCSATPCNEPNIDGINVQLTANTNFVYGSLADVADGVAMAVSGTFDAASGKLVASAAAVRRSDPERGLVTLIGTVSEYASAGGETHFRVRGVPVITDGSTNVEPGCSINDGQVVAIAGHISGSAVLASRVACPPLAVGLVVDAYGSITDLSTTDKTFKLAGRPLLSLATLVWDDDTIFNNGATPQNLANGQYVGLRAVYQGSGRFLLKRVILDDTPPPSPVPGVLVFGTWGIAHHITANSLIVNRIPMTIDAGSDIGPGVANGSVVRAWFYRDVPNQQWVALRVRPVIW